MKKFKTDKLTNQQTSKPTAEESRNYASKLLKYRNRSEKELREKLKQKGFAEETVTATVGWLKEKRYLDDRQFAQEWIESRKRKGYSEKYIRWELKKKGIINESLEPESDRPEELPNDREVARKLVAKKISQSKNIQPEKIKQRIQNLLLRHGFGWEIIEEILNNDCND